MSHVEAEFPTVCHTAKNPGGLGVRHVQIFLIFCGFTMASVLKINMSIAIVAMSNSTTANPDFKDYGWENWKQSIIMSSVFWGSVPMQVPGGQIAQMWSASRFWALCMFVCSVVNLLIPIAADIGGWKAVFACRVVMGLCQGCVFPSVHTLLGKWVPTNERSRLGTFAYAGGELGTVVGSPVFGFLAASSYGWPSIFYLVGAVTIAWSVIFFIWGSDSPAHHGSIKPAERAYIEESLGQVDVKKRLPTPWKAIFTSLPVWALIVVHIAQDWGYWLLASEIPTYLNSILQFDICSNGLISALPYLAMVLLSFPISWTSDYALEKGWVTRGAARKISNSIGHWGPAVALLGLGYAKVDQRVVAVVVLIFTVGLNAGIYSGYQINHIDLSPNFAGTLMAITNGIASTMPILVSLIIGLIVVDESDITQWRTVFFISAGIYFLGNLFFVLFGKGEVQSWNEPEVERNAESGKTGNAEENSDRNKSQKIQ